jgi:integrase
MIQEWVTELKQTTFERKKPDGTVFKRYTLARKSVLHLVVLMKTIVGRKVARDWDIKLGRAARPRQRFFTEDEPRRIIEAARGQSRVLLATLAGTGLRIGEALGLQVADIDLEHGVIHVRRSIWRGQAVEPKTDNALRTVDIGAALVALLRTHLGDRKEGWVFPSGRGTPMAAENVRNRILSPLLDQLGIAKAGAPAFRHSRVTLLRKYGSPEHVIKQWIGHSALDKRTTDTYCHTDQDLAYRQQAAGAVGLNRLFGPNGLVLDPIAIKNGEPVKSEI